MAASGQSAKVSTDPDLTKAYTQAISDFIKAANEKNTAHFDTLFILKRKNNQPDDFPDIVLPKEIEQTQIIVTSPEQSKSENKKNVYLNLMGWVSNTTAEFIFVVFSNGFEHQYDYTLNYKYNLELNKFELVKLGFKGAPFDK